MNFELNDEQKMMQQIVRDFATRVITPGAAERDEREAFSRPLFDAIGEMGLTGICFPEKYGGADGDWLSYILAVEEVARADASLGVSFPTSVGLCQWPIYAFGTEEQKQKYLVPLVAGQRLGAFALTEPNAGTDAARQKTGAVLKDNHYVINGTKVFITNAGEAETYVVFAMTDKSKGVKGISAFIVEKGMPGFTFGKLEHKMGIRSSPTMELILQDVEVPLENLLGKEGEGYKIALNALDVGRIGIAAQALGIAQSALENAIKYSKERVQFGGPLASKQAIAFMIADMATKVDAARFFTYRAAWLKDQGKPYTKEAAMAKMYASDIAMEVTSDAIQIFGGYGYIRDFPVERLMRDAKITQIYEGTNQVQRMVISGAVLK